MSERPFAVIAVACAIAALSPPARPAAAAVTLRSADITTESFSYRAGPVGTSPLPVLDNTHTVTGPNPFPNDTKNVAAVTDEGLHVLVNLTGEASHSLGLFVSDSHTDQHFRVVFDLDAPAPFAFSPPPQVVLFLPLMPTLRAEGQAPIPLSPFSDTTGILPAGQYTFAADIYPSSWLTGERVSSVTVDFRDVKLTVAPEPNTLALALAGAGILVALRRPRRADDPSSRCSPGC